MLVLIQDGIASGIEAEASCDVCRRAPALPTNPCCPAAFDLAFGALFSKVYRVRRIVSNAPGRRVRTRRSFLPLVSGMLLLFAVPGVSCVALERLLFCFLSRAWQSSCVAGLLVQSLCGVVWVGLSYHGEWPGLSKLQALLSQLACVWLAGRC